MPQETIASSKAKIRPFKTGEFVQNPDGTVSTERSVTFQAPDGSWMNAPSLWMGPKGVMDFGTDEGAIADIVEFYERTTGERFPRFKTLDEAVSEAEARSKRGGAFQGSMAQ